MLFPKQRRCLLIPVVVIVCEFYYVLLRDPEEELSIQQTQRPEERRLQLGSHTKGAGVFWFNLCCNQGASPEPGVFNLWFSDVFT